MPEARTVPVTCKIENVQFAPAEVSFVMDSKVAPDGRPHVGKAFMSTHLRVNLNNETCDFSTIQRLFELGKEPCANDIKDVTLTYYVSLKDQNTTCSIQYKGWVSSLRISFLGQNAANYNHVLDIVVTTDTTNPSWGYLRVGN
jgi:hypothetical protein